MKRQEEPEKENSERWLLTYSDLITLLMIFFIIMYAISSLNTEKYYSLARSLSSVLGSGTENVVGQGQGSIIDFGQSGGTSDTQSDNNSVTSDTGGQDELSNIAEELRNFLVENGLEDYVIVYTDERGLSVRLKDSIIFDSGRADIKGVMKDTIQKIGSILSKVDSYIRVEGHTDNIPISNSEFQSNWQLSSARASNVAELLIEGSGIPPQKISIVGYGEYRPIADNSTSEGRSQNRRVEIVLVNSKFNAMESSK